jgi:hypothetical protein
MVELCRVQFGIEPGLSHSKRKGEASLHRVGSLLTKIKLGKVKFVWLPFVSRRVLGGLE